jgi:hypothetical protein
MGMQVPCAQHPEHELAHGATQTPASVSQVLPLGQNLHAAPPRPHLEVESAVMH